MSYIIYGFLFGCFIPYLARRIGKQMPATLGNVLLNIFVPTHYMPWQKLKENKKYTELFRRYLMRSLGWGIFTAAATIFFVLNFNLYFRWWHIVFLWLSLLLVETDKRFTLLPDLLTVPLLILGFAYAVFAVRSGSWLSNEFLSYTQNSAIGAVLGYLMPVAASLFILWKYPEAFGGGDIKLLAAIGAWVGLEKIAYIILGSCIIFATNCLINHRRDGPFGPAIIYAALIVISLNQYLN